jgi:hypothetical protein
MIRAINIELGLFYIVSPVPADIIVKTNTLVRGSGMDLPVNLFVDGFENVRNDLPYMTYKAPEGLGGLSKRIRFLQRKKFI